MPVNFQLPASGWRRLLAAFCTGVLMTLALPPAGFFPVLLLCIPFFVRFVQSCATKRAAFLTGWAFGAGYFICGLYWVSFALFVDIGTWWWVLPLAVVAGPTVLALYYGLIPLLAWRYRRDKTAHAVMLVAAFALVEWVRGHALTGFPWNLAGYAWHHVLPLMQVNAVAGIYGLTLLTLLWAATPLLPKKAWPFLILSFLLALAAGGIRLSLHPAAGGDETVRVVQPNIAQTAKWDVNEMVRNFRHLLALTASSTATFTVWPETAMVADERDFASLARMIGDALPRDGVALIGAQRAAADKYYNSVLALDARGRVRGTYDKHHLVPFGEYIPFRRYLNMTPIAASVARIGDFTPGPGVMTLALGDRPRPSPLVCYEAIFPGAVARDDDRPGWLLNVTNDAWYGATAGPHQHFEIVRVRAVEEGLPLVRAANTGISGVIDPLGRIVGKKELGETGVVDAALPRALLPTPYARFGDALFFLMLALLAITGEALRSRP